MKFKDPIYVTKPLMPDLGDYQAGLGGIWSKKWLSNNGDYSQQLEVELADYLNVENILTFNNGTTALMAAIKALDLSGEVITTPFTFPATTHAISWNGLQPVFCDIDPQTLTIDPSKIEALITEKTSAILGVHVYGMPCNVVEIERIAKKYDLKVIYDAAHAFAVSLKGKPISIFGDVTMFSFHPTKLFHTAEGGGLVSNNKDLMEKLAQLRNFGYQHADAILSVGINGKMNELSALMGLKVLPLVKEEKNKRKAIAKIYRSELSVLDAVSFFDFPKEVECSEQYFPVFIQHNNQKNRDGLHQYLKEFNIFSRPYFAPLVPEYNCYQDIDIKNSLPIATKAASEVLCLPYYGDLAHEEVRTICRLIRQYFDLDTA